MCTVYFKFDAQFTQLIYKECKEAWTCMEVCPGPKAVVLLGLIVLYPPVDNGGGRHTPLATSLHSPLVDAIYICCNSETTLLFLIGIWEHILSFLYEIFINTFA